MAVGADLLTPASPLREEFRGPKVGDNGLRNRVAAGASVDGKGGGGLEAVCGPEDWEKTSARRMPIE